MSASPSAVYSWRHPAPPRAIVAGRCVGRWDVPVDRRKAKRLAHRLRRTARRDGLPRVVWTSSLWRCALVGQWLRRFGFTHVIDDLLSELDFGAWEGLPWSAIGAAAVTAWESDFMRHAPGQGEALATLLDRVRGFVAGRAGQGPCLVVAHAGWINALVWLTTRPGEEPTAVDWPMAPAYGALTIVPAVSGGSRRP